MFYKQYRTNKFKNKRTEFGGRLYASKLESSVAADLELAKKAKNKWERVVKVIPQYPIDIYLDGDKITDEAKPNRTIKLFRYYADFWVEYQGDNKELIEVKGFVTDLFRIKWKIVEQLYSIKYPDVKLTIIR